MSITSPRCSVRSRRHVEMMSRFCRPRKSIFSRPMSPTAFMSYCVTTASRPGPNCSGVYCTSGSGALTTPPPWGVTVRDNPPRDRGRAHIDQALLLLAVLVCLPDLGALLQRIVEALRAPLPHRHELRQPV